MQIKSIETRSLPEIWAGLTQPQRDSIIYGLIGSKCTTTRQTVWNWTTGKTQPATIETKDHVAKVVGKVLGTRVLSHTLFPSAK